MKGTMKGNTMFKRLLRILALFTVALTITPAWADDYTKTISVFKKAGAGVGGAYGNGRVYQKGKYVGDTSMTQLSIGFQLGGEGFSQIVFFEDERAFKEFTSGNFEFGTEASAVAITAAAGAKANTAGSSAGASAGKNDATTVGRYHKGMATFTVVKGGLMYEATIGGHKFSYQAL